VHIPSQENKRSCLFVVSILPLFLRSLDYALEIFYQCAFLKNNIDMHIHKSSYHSDMKRKHMTGVTSGAGTAIPFGAPEFTIDI
jgi:hypothetical protein